MAPSFTTLREESELSEVGVWQEQASTTVKMKRFLILMNAPTEKLLDFLSIYDHNRIMKKRDNLIFTSGSLKSEDKEWDRAFWALATTEQKFLATSDLVRFAHEIKSNEKLSMHVDKFFFESGSLSDR
jgi:hypothetical protein